ncbi:MAG: hypothetical protein JRN15_23005, partial [Nitrososphaerota archaeon]|nr:hypothetical protein [Nitrososphaerota archaeon]
GILPPPCIPPPLVVGYSLSEVNSTDFTAWTNPTSCPPGFDATAFYVGLTNMQVGFVPYYYTPSNTST